MQLNEIWSIIEERNKVNVYDDSNMKLLYHGEPAYMTASPYQSLYGCGGVMV